MATYSLPLSRWFYQGLPAASGTLAVYQSGTTTPVVIYSDAALLNPTTNPITLDSNGEARFYVDTSVTLRLDARTVGGTLIQTLDPVYPLTSDVIAEISIASGTTTDIGSTGSRTVLITGSTTINSFGSSASISKPIYNIRFAAPLTLTYNATSMVLPGSANITTAANDSCVAQYLGSGNWRVLSYSRAVGVPLFTVKRQVIPASGTYTPSTGMVSADVECWGAGGGGGGASTTTNASGAGGGQGGYARKSLTAAAIGASQTVTIGAGGTVGANTGTAGGTGGTTSLGALVVATGGTGGAGNTGTGTAAPGTAGAGTTGEDLRTGTPGNVGWGGTTGWSGAGGGQGGGASLTVGNNANGNSGAANSGAGGGGAFNSASTGRTGGLGGSGYCVITEYCSQ